MDSETWREAQATVEVDVDRHTFDVAYHESGAGDTVTVFLHGIPTWGFLWREVIDAVGHAVVPDLPGHGYTRHRSEGGFDRSVKAQTEYLEAILDKLGLGTVQLVAHDIGGAVALRLAIESDRVDRLVLSNATCYDSWPVPFILEYGAASRARAMTYQDVQRELRELFTNGVSTPDRATDTFVDGMIAPYIAPDVPPTRLSRNAVATDTNHTLELAPRHDEIDAETLLLWGYPGSGQHAGYARRLATDIPDADTEFIGDTHHWVVQEQPAAYADGLASFLE
ncbi:MAG: alpha/beta fold hydrolase [Salinirussus sp.]